MNRKEVYLEEYINLLNKSLKNHPQYKSGQEIKVGINNGLAFNSENKTITPEENTMFNQVVSDVDEIFKLISP